MFSEPPQRPSEVALSCENLKVTEAIFNILQPFHNRK